MHKRTTAIAARSGKPFVIELADTENWKPSPEWKAPRIPQAVLDAELPPLQRLAANPPAREPGDIQPDIRPRPMGSRVRVCIESEKELQILGCGWRTLTVELDGKEVHLHHNGNTATMKRDAFKEFLASNRRYRRDVQTITQSTPTRAPWR